MDYKICTQCKENKPFNEFPSNSKTKDKLGSWCRCCCNEYDRCDVVECECGKQILKKDYRKHIQRYIHRKYINKLKRCRICKEEKPFENFINSTKTSDGLECMCINCKHAKFYINK